MSVAQHAPSRPATRKPRKPDPARVYSVFLYEASTAGRRNAASRTAAAIGLSDDMVRRIVAKFERPDDTPPEVQYQPAPGQVEYEVKRELQARELASNAPVAAASVESEPQTVPQNDDVLTRPLMSSNEPDDRVFEQEMRQIGIDLAGEQPQTATPQRRTGELANEPQTAVAMPQTAAAPRRYPPRPLPARRGPDMAQLRGWLFANWGTVLLLAGLGYVIVGAVLKSAAW